MARISGYEATNAKIATGVTSPQIAKNNPASIRLILRRTKAGIASKNVIISDKTAIRDVLVKGEDFPDLMVRWLGEILYLFEGENFIVHSIEIKSISPIQLKSTLSLSSFEPEYHRVLREIKAVTYHQISVDKTNDGWEARVIFDI